MTGEQGNKKNRRVRNDVLLLSVLLLAAVLALGIYAWGRRTGTYVQVTVNGEVHATYALSEDRTVLLPSYDGQGKNLLVIFDGTARVTEADCPDCICVQHAPISRVNDTIVCLPHRVVITVREAVR